MLLLLVDFNGSLDVIFFDNIIVDVLCISELGCSVPAVCLFPANRLLEYVRSCCAGAFPELCNTLTIQH